MSDEQTERTRDWLAVARVAFDVEAPTHEEAIRRAHAAFDPFVEADDLIGDGHVGRATGLETDRWSVSGDMSFRTQGDDLADAAAFARTRLGDVVAASGFLSTARLVAIREDA